MTIETSRHYSGGGVFTPSGRRGAWLAESGSVEAWDQAGSSFAVGEIVIRKGGAQGLFFEDHPAELHPGEGQVDADVDRSQRGEQHPEERDELEEVHRMADQPVGPASDQATRLRKD